MSGTQGWQAAEVRSEGDIKENEMWDISQKVKACAESPIPIQLDAPSLAIRIGERSTVQSNCQSTLNVESNVEVTSPQKPRYWAQMQEAKVDHATAQEVTKNQKGKGRIKKIAREKGQTQRKEKQALSPNSGTKRQIALLFTKGEVENLDNSARKRKCEVLLTLIMVFMVVLLLVLLMVFMMVLLMVLIMMMLMVFRMVLLLVFIVLLTVFMMNLIYQRWLQRSTARSHEFLRLELPGAWEPPVSSSIA